jgi:predicted Fe-Mo cluster-binding NifX family protein
MAEKNSKGGREMRIAISTDNGYVSAHFGRCPSYTLVDIEDGKVLKSKLIENPEHSPGFLPGFLSQHGVGCIITGGMGMRAQGLFTEMNIETIIGVTGKIDDVIEKFLKGSLVGGESLCDRGNHQDHNHSECEHK